MDRDIKIIFGTLIGLFALNTIKLRQLARSNQLLIRGMDILVKKTTLDIEKEIDVVFRDIVDRYDK